MKIVHIINSISSGGAENLVLNSIEGFKRYSPDTRHYLVVLYGVEPDDKRLSNFEQTVFLKTTFLKLVLKIISLRKWIHKNAIDVIHSHLFDSLLFCRLIKSSSTRLIHTYHSIDYKPGTPYHSPWRIKLDLMTYRKTPSIYVSNAVKSVVQFQIPKQKPNGKVISNFCSEHFEYQWGSDKKNAELRLIAVGNLREAKNYELLINAMEKLKDLKISADVYGEGLLRKSLQAQINQTGAKVVLKGEITMSSELFSRYDCFLMTSKIEGMPISLIEAITSGMPSILPKHLSVMKEVAGDSALYFENLDSLVKHIESLQNNPSKLIQMSREARVQSKSFSLKDYSQKCIEMYCHG